MEDRKKNTGILVALIIFILLTLMLGGYIVYDKLNNKVNSDNTSNNANTAETGAANEEVVESNQAEDSGEYFKKVNYDYAINGKIHKIDFYYSLGDVLPMDKEEGFNYGVYLTIGIDGKILDFTKNIVAETKTQEEINSLEVYKNYNINNVNLIKGTDKDYMVLRIEHLVIHGKNINPIIINDSGDLIEKIDLKDNSGVSIPGNEHYENWEEFYITGDSLYYLETICNNAGLTANEYKLTISNNRAVKTQINTYDNADGSGQCY